MSVTTRLNRTMLHGQRFLLMAWLGLATCQAFANEPPPVEAVDEVASAASASVGDEIAPTTLTPRMQRALDYVKTRFKISKEAIHPLFEAVQRIGKEHGIDPLLIVAIISIESGFKPHVKSAGGGHGLMQVIPRYHLDKIPDGLGVKGLMDPVVNVKVGTRILDEAIRRTGSPVAGLQSYNGSDKKRKFANRGLAEKARLERAEPSS